MWLKYKNNKNFYFNKELLFIFVLYLTLLISFILDENSTGGAITDYYTNKSIILNFAREFKETFLNFDSFSTRHSPIFLIFLSLFEKQNLSDEIIRLIHLHTCLLLPYFFFKILEIKFKNVDKKILLLLTGIIFLSPTFRSLIIWPDSRLLGLIFFTLSILFFLRFKQNHNFKYVILNIATCALSAYISPNFSVFSLYFFTYYIRIYSFLSKKTFYISLTNILLALPAIYYVFILDINFFNKTAATNFDNNDKIFFNNIFNDILITFSIFFFYLIPFYFEKFIKIYKVFDIYNILISLSLLLLCIYFFNYKHSYSGGGIFFKISNNFLGNNSFFYFISFFSICFVISHLTFDIKNNLLLFVLIILNNPQYTLYHKYFDPFLMIVFFSLFNFEISLKNKKIKNFFLIYVYFLIFLIINNIKYIWIN